MCRGVADVGDHLIIIKPASYPSLQPSPQSTMSYQVLARKWRPRNFTEVVGQEHVLQALVHALERDRLHHAYLFTGTRGVGKTTIARILAKSLNCENAGVSAHPCGTCGACREVDEGRFVDLIEVDAASRTKVEETRELLDNVQYMPTKGRFKVYLIDEVHMFSGHSFNALLKTLEEPPPHVKFLLATTDPQKLPITIRSRCLQFNLKRISRQQIAAQLGTVLQQESIDYEEAALDGLARAADGSIRDALSLLDQAIAFGGGRVQEVEVKQMLGTIEQRHLLEMVAALAVGDAERLLQQLDQLGEQVADFQAVLQALISSLHQLALLQWVPSVAQERGIDPEWLPLAQQISAEDLQLYYQIATMGLKELPLAATPRSGLEMTLLRMLAFRPLTENPTAEPLPATPTSPSDATRSSSPTSSPVATPKPLQSTAAVEPKSLGEESAPGAWGEMVEQLPLDGLVKEMLRNSLLLQQGEDHFVIEISSTLQSMINDLRCQKITEALSDHLSRTVKVTLQVAASEQQGTPEKQDRQREAEMVAAAVEKLGEDQAFQSLLTEMDGSVVEGSIRPQK